MDSNSAQAQGPGRPPQFVSRRALGNGGITDIPVLSVFSQWTNSNVGLTYVGLEDLNGAKVLHIVLQLPPSVSTQTPRPEPPCDIYLDSQTFLVTQLVYTLHALSDLKFTAPVTVKYEDYRTVQGVQVPFKVTNLMGANVVSTQIVTSVNFNVPVTDATFTLSSAQ